MGRSLSSLALVLAACGGDPFANAPASGGSGGAAGSSASGGVAGSGGSSTGGTSSGGNTTGGAAGDGGTAGASPCGGADLATDSKNCGLCGHDCIESACTNGECDGKELINGVQPKGLAIDGDTLYFADANTASVRQMPRDGSGAATSFAVSQTGITYLAFANGVVYWTRTSGQLMKKAPSDAAATQLCGQMANPLGVAVAGGSSYVAENGTNRLLQVPITGGNPTQLRQMTPNGIEGIATDGQEIWVAYNGGTTLASVPMNGASESPFATNQGAPAGVAVDSDSVYWANQGSGEIRRKAKSTAAHFTLKTGVNHPVGVAVDDAFVYCSEGNAQRIMRIAK